MVFDMVNLITGRSGSGKSTLIVDMIISSVTSSQRGAVLIVPEQQTVMWETKLAELLPASANLRLEITNFTRLSNSVFREYGGLSDTVVDEGSRALLVWRAMLSVWDELKIYNNTSSGREDRCIPYLMRAVDEMKSSGISPADAEEALSRLAGEDDPASRELVSRLSDAVLVYSAYNSILHKEYIDRGDLLDNMAKTLDTHPYFIGKDVYIDSFFSLTKPEERVVASVIRQADNVTLTFPCADTADGDDGEMQFGEVRDYLKKIMRIAAKCGKETAKIALHKNLRHKNAPDIALVEKYIFDFSASLNSASATTADDGDASDSQANGGGRVKIIRCADRYDEAEACAAIIEKHLREGMSYSDIAVIAHDIGTRENIVDAVLRRHDIRCFMSESSAVSSSPAVRLILAALQVAAGGWQRRDVIRLLKTGMTPAGRRGYIHGDSDPLSGNSGEARPDSENNLEMFEAEVFETYTATWNIHGKRAYSSGPWYMNPDGYKAEITDSGRLMLEYANSAKEKIIPPLVRFLSVFDTGTASVRDVATAAVAFAEEYGVAQTLNEISCAYRAIGMPADAEKAAASWSAVCKILDKMVDALGDTLLDTVRFSGLFSLVAESMDSGTIPTGVDEVILGSASGVRFDSAKCVIMLGSVEGEFPAPVHESSSFFGERDRLILESAGMEISTPDTGMQLAREYFMYYRVAAAAREYLYVLSPSENADSLSCGAKRIATVLSACTASTEREFNMLFSQMPLCDILFSCAGAEYLLARRRGEDDIALLNTVAGKRVGADATVSLTAEEDVIPGAGNAVREAAGGKISLTQTKINTFVLCPFNYSCKFLLKLAPEPKAEIRTPDIGSFMHKVLEKFFSEMPAEQLSELSFSQDELEEEADRIISEYIADLAKFSPRGEESDGRLKYLFTRLRRYVLVFLEAMLRSISSGSFKPVAFELPIGYGGDGMKPVTFTTDSGCEVTLRGIADRVDMYTDENGVRYVQIVDYKTGDKSFSLDSISKGLDVQLLIYLFSIWKFGMPGYGDETIIPARAMYFCAKPAAYQSSEMLPAEEARDFVIDKIYKSGIYLDDEDIISALGMPQSDKTAKKGYAGFTPSSVEEFGRLYDELSATLKKISNEITGGVAAAKPYRTKSSDPCSWCDNKFVCKVNRDFTYDE